MSTAKCWYQEKTLDTVLEKCSFTQVGLIGHISVQSGHIPVYANKCVLGVASFAVTLPTMFMLVEWSTLMSTSSQLLLCYAINGVFFHCQTISAYYLMDYISPVTHSVANTAKRAALIWSSVLLFGNEITLLSGLGTTVVIAGVLLYNMATEVDSRNVKTLVQVGSGKMFVDKVWNIPLIEFIGIPNPLYDVINFLW